MIFSKEQVISNLPVIRYTLSSVVVKKRMKNHLTSRFFNRELSHLQFFIRVFEQAKDPKIPLLERLKFLFITSANLDEFFEIRVAGLQEKIALSRSEIGVDGMSTTETLVEIAKVTHALVAEVYQTFNEELLPALTKENIYFLPPKEWSTKQRAWAKAYFVNHIMPVISPIGLDLAHPFPRLVNKSLNYIVSLEGEDAFGRSSGLAIIHAPRTLPRVLQFPKEICGEGDYLIFLHHLIQQHVDDFFPGMKTTGCYQFRITRNSEIYLNPEEITDLTFALQTELASKRYGSAVRLEIDSECPDKIVDYLLSIHHLDHIDLYRVKGPVNLHRFNVIFDLVNRPNLQFPPLVQSIPAVLSHEKNIFEAIKSQDILLHHPYDTFNTVLDFIYQAARDPQVLAIKQTLYRTGVDSPMVKALVEAAKNGKEVTTVIELRARFDEAENIELANKLQEAGVVVIYGIFGYKIHAKLCLIIRRENGGLCRYAHLSTGNYHAHTARQYVDFGLFTSQPEITQDVLTTFLQLTSMGKVGVLNYLYISPFSLHKAIINLIDTEIRHVESGGKAFIKAKMNALTEPAVIEALYRASQAGVKIELTVRGICSLRPGVKGLSTNITVYSIIGQYLEHERVYWFHNNGKDKVFCSSADWMDRNFYYRVEICFPILDDGLAKEVRKLAFNHHIQPHSSLYRLMASGEYRIIDPSK